MPGFLFHEVVFGPVRSRRLGLSLGINLLPLHAKYCSFNCIYCECGWTPKHRENPPEFPSREEVSRYLEQRLQQLAAESHLPDAITYAGNGEPTLHPEFAAIVDDTMTLRDRYAPAARVTVLSNASTIHLPEVFKALKKIDNNILKLDAGLERMFGLINNPVEPVPFRSLVGNLAKFEGDVIIQSMFLRVLFKGETIDNTTPEEVEAWLKHLAVIRPKMVMIYPIARETPVHGLEKIGPDELERIAEKVRQIGLKVQVYQ
jgi:wyosine [tRNA(Phe)-imidazoG37] synthetase (radical SAM superfamily)